MGGERQRGRRRRRLWDRGLAGVTRKGDNLKKKWKKIHFLSPLNHFKERPLVLAAKILLKHTRK